MSKSKTRLGLRSGIVSGPAFANMDDLFVPIETVLKKAGQGFGRGPKAAHKYWRRQRVIVGGKLNWRYYYNTDKDRKRWVEDRARMLARKRKKLGSHEARLKTEADTTAGSGHTRAEHAEHHARVETSRRELSALTTEYVNTILNFENPPDLIVSDLARAEYMQAIEDATGPKGDKVDPHGEQIHALRALEHAYSLMPQSFMKFFDGDIESIEMTTAAEDAKLRSMKASGYCSYIGGGKSQIKLGMDLLLKGRVSHPYGKEEEEVGLYGMKGGAWAVEVMVHEMAHSVQCRMGGSGNVITGYRHDHADELRRRGWKGGVWKDWLTFLDGNTSKHKKAGADGNKYGKNRGEKGITKYANENPQERWAESFTACLMYPHQMAARCPKTYDYFRANVFGPEVMHPRLTDPAIVANATEALAAATTAEDRKIARERLTKATGLDEIAPLDPRMRWWERNQPSEVQRAMTAAATDNQAFMPKWSGAGEVHRVDPPDTDKIGQQRLSGSRKWHDRFYEMNYRGRTVYMRYGPPASGQYKHWEPRVPGHSPELTGQVAGDKACIKEVYDENGKAIHPDLMYLHLVQDELVDGAIIAMVKVNGKDMPVTTEEVHAYLTGVGTKEQNERVAKLIGSDGKAAGRLFLRSFTKGKTGHEKLPELQALYADLNAESDDAKKQAIQGKIVDLESKLNDVNWDQIKKTKGGMPLPITMTPHETTHREFKQRSGTFAYDQIKVKGDDLLVKIKRERVGSARHKKLLDELRKVQPGVATVNRRNKKTGKFQRGNVRLDGKGQPVFNTLRYVNDNPDGSQTVIDTVRDPKSGRYTLANPMWRDLLTPNNEEIRSAADLEKAMRAAAGKKTRAWVSLKTDRERVQTSTGKWKMAKRGDTDHHFHLEVEFDGKGQPKIVGDYWQKQLGKDTPRLDDLIVDDPVFGKFRKGARAIVMGEAIRLKKESDNPPWTADNPPRETDRVILSVTGGEQRSASAVDKDIVATLTKVIPGKKKGELPPPPGWDRMPEGTAQLFSTTDPLTGEEANKAITANIAPKQKALRAKIRRLKREGVLPEWYSHTTREAAWFAGVYTPALKQWNQTKEIKRQEEYETQYVFTGQNAGGAVGQVFLRPESEVHADIRRPAPAMVPIPLKQHALAYLHHSVDPRTGVSVENEIRLVPAESGNPTLAQLVTQPGCRGIYALKMNPLTGKNEKILKGVTVKVDQFKNLRGSLGALSITDEVNQIMADRYATAKAAEIARKDESHVIEQEEIDPTNMARTWGVKLNETLPNGAKFRLGIHQQKLLQKMLDNDGRILAAHYMGTGKTVSALSAAQIMLRRPARPQIPKDLVGEARQKWLEENPWDTSRLHPDNPKRILVVAPLNTVEQWRQSAYDFDEGAQVVGSGSNDIPIDSFTGMPDDQRAEIVVVGPEYFTLHAAKLKECGFDGLVIDEVHMGIKNEEANRNKVVREWNDDMKMMMLLTGTPMTTHPADFVEYIRLLSKGAVFGDMTKAKFIEEYCMESDIPSKTGAPGAGPKVKIKPEKMAELAAILDQYMDVAMPKDVRGKTLPATRVGEGRTAVMRGIQEQMYNLYMGLLGDQVDLASLSAEELEQMDEGVRKSANTAKALANCVGYKPSSDDPYVMVEVINPETGKPRKDVFRPPVPDALRKQKVPRWPGIQELTVRYGSANKAVSIFDAYCGAVLGHPYAMLAGKPVGYGVQIGGKPDDPFKMPVSKAQRDEALRRMDKAGWPGSIPNPDRGPLGITFRGNGVPLLDELKAAGKWDEVRKLEEKIDHAAEFQRAYRRELAAEAAEAGNELPTDPEHVLHGLASKWGVDDPYELLHMTGNPIRFEDTLTAVHAGEEVQVATGETWVSDQSGSRHLLYERDDWDNEQNAPKPGGPATEKTRAGSLVMLADKARKKIGVDHTPPKRPSRKDFPPGKVGTPAYQQAIVRHKEILKHFAPPKYQLVGVDGAATTVRILSGPDQGKTVVIPTSAVTVPTASLMDPGKREARRRADIAMTHQNGKADELRAHIARFHDGAEAGPDGARQMVAFGNGILDACRTMEATARSMGLVDVNEALEGSPHFDPSDPTTKGDPPSPTAKYFVTYIGATYTGNRELNVAIFQKVKDKLNRDTDVSLFVHKCSEGRSPSSFRDEDGNKYGVDWQVYPGDLTDNHLEGTDVASISMSQWTADQREVIDGQFKIRAPEAHLTIEKNGTESPAYFYGTEFTPAEQKAHMAQFGQIMDGDKPLQFRTSGDLLRAMTLVGDPARMASVRRDVQNSLVAAGANQADVSMVAATGDVSPLPAATRAAIQRLKAASPDLTGRYLKLLKDRKDIVSKVDALKREYTRVARANSTDKAPLTAKQEHVFNNCELMICSDAAQVGMNLGNSAEMVMYDTLGSPMAEAQRMTRCARMLPSTIPEDLMGSKVMVAKTRVKRDSAGRPLLDPKTKKALEVPVMKLSDEAIAEISTLRAKQGLSATTAAEKQALQSKIDAVSKDKARRVPVMVQQTDELGRPVFASDGPFTELRRMEKEIFGAKGVRAHNPGSIEGVSLADNLGGGKLLDGERVTIPQALDAARQALLATAEDAKSNALSARLHRMAARCQTARNLGPAEGARMLESLRKEVIPGTSDTFITYDEALLTVPRADSGTYTGAETIVTDSVENAVRDWIDGQPQSVQDEIMKSGFTATENGEVSSHDAAGVYLAIRAQEVLTWLEDNREEVTATMRNEDGGDVITDNEVTNRLIDMLTDTDRAILKTKKYLVNVRKLTAGGNVGQTVKYAVEQEVMGPDGPVMKKVSKQIFAGFEREYPVSTERRTQTTQRARQRSAEDIFEAVQNGVEFRASGHFVSASAGDVASISVIGAMAKSWALARAALVFDLDALDSRGIR